VAIRLDGKNLVVPRAEALQASGREFAYLGVVRGVVVTVPVNSR
jgi:hypothetical protein